MTQQALVLAGIYNSGPEHWQTIWQREDARFHKLEHSEWENPECSVWVRELEDEVARLGPNVTLVAHSLACLLVAHWAKTTQLRVDGALLVSVPNALGPDFPSDAKNFDGEPLEPLPFPSTVVSSTDDPYGTSEFMQQRAQSWGSRFVSVGALGHINESSNVGAWEPGRALLRELMD